MHTFLARPSRRAAITLAAAAVAAMTTACGDGGPLPPTLSTAPQNLTLHEGGSGAFSVTAESRNGGTLTYQWFDGATGLPIGGETGTVLAIDNASLALDGRTVNVQVIDDEESTRSADVTLTVTERAWSAAADALPQRSRQHASVVDANGHVHLVGVLGNNLAAGVEARIQMRGSDPTQAGDFDALPSGGLLASAALSPLGSSTSVALAASRGGYVVAVWHRNGTVGGALYTPGPDGDTPGTWAPLPESVSTAGSTATDPDVAAVGPDSFEIVWRERASGGSVFDVQERRFNASTSSFEGAPVPLEELNTDVGAPRIVADAAGNVLAAWKQGSAVVVNRRLAADAWQPAPVTVDTSGYPLEVLRANVAGRAVLLTSDRLGSVLATRLDLAAANPVLDAASMVANAYGSAPDAVVDASGRLHVFGVSMDNSNNHTRLFRWVYTDAAGWGSPEPVSESNTADFVVTLQGVVGPRVSDVDDEGSFVVAWQDRVDTGDSELSHVSGRRFHGALGAWRATAAPFDSGNRPLAIVMRPDGRATLASNGTGATVIASTLR